MKVEVIKDFTDKFDIRIIHKVGAVMDMDDERAEKAIKNGVVKEFVAESIKEVKKPTKKVTKAKAD